MIFKPDKSLVKELKKIIRGDLKFPKGSGWVSRTIRNGNMVIYINKKLGMIVKAPAIIIGKEAEGITLPTVNLGYGWVLQPICSFEDRKEAYLELEKKIGPEDIDKIAYDFHLQNLGWWHYAPGKRTARMFDW